MYYLAADEDAALLLEHQRPLEGLLSSAATVAAAASESAETAAARLRCQPYKWIDAFHTAPPLLSNKSSQ